jgi:hypothetical protein
MSDDQWNRAYNEVLGRLNKMATEMAKLQKERQVRDDPEIVRQLEGWIDEIEAIKRLPTPDP